MSAMNLSRKGEQRGLPEKLDARKMRAWDILSSKRCDIRRFRKDEEDSYLVKSQSTTGYYEVRKLKDSTWVCECPDYKNRRIPCKHIYAVRFKLERN